MDRFEFIEGGIELIDYVKPLWEKLNKLHEDNAQYFKEKFKNNTFDARKSKFLDYNNFTVKVDLIKEVKSSEYIGYCVSTVNKDLIGELDSLYIEGDYRKYGLGDKLMQSALGWFDKNHVKTKVIAVAEGNEDVLAFYRKYGFYTRRIVLEQI